MTPTFQVDFQHEEAFALPVRPDVLVLPSDLGRNTEVKPPPQMYTQHTDTPTTICVVSA